MDAIKEVLQILLQRRVELNSIEIEDDLQALIIQARLMELETIIAMVEKLGENKI